MQCLPGRFSFLLLQGCMARQDNGGRLAWPRTGLFSLLSAWSAFSFENNSIFLYLLAYANVLQRAYNETQGLLGVRFITTLTLDGSIWVFVCSFIPSFLVCGHFNLKIYVNSC